MVQDGLAGKIGHALVNRRELPSTAGDQHKQGDRQEAYSNFLDGRLSGIGNLVID
jgi:hypothetical protein